MEDYELSMLANTVESRSLLDDVFETIDRLHHRIVATAQLEFQRKKDQAYNVRQGAIELLQAENPHMTQVEAEMYIERDFERYLNQEKKKLQQFIERMMTHRDRIRNASFVKINHKAVDAFMADMDCATAR